MSRSTHPRLTTLLCAVGLGATLIAQAGQWQDLGAKLRAAYDQKQYAEMKAIAQQQVALAPNAVGPLYNLACAQALSGDSSGALASLSRLARMQIALDPAKDPDFASLARRPEFEAVRRKLAPGEVRHATPGPALAETDFIAEDLTFDPGTRSLLVSSVRRGKIVRVPIAGGPVEDLVEPAADTWGYFGLAANPTTGVLWASTAAVPEYRGELGANPGKTALLRFELKTGRRLSRLELPALGRHVLGDLTLDAQGGVFVTDSVGGGVYRVPPSADSFQAVVPAGTFVSPQQPALAADGRHLFVPDSVRGIARVELATGSVRWLKAPEALVLSGIDGMIRDGEGLIVIQNGVQPARVVRLRLSADQAEIRSFVVLERGGALTEPSHGLLGPRGFTFLAESGWKEQNLPEAARQGHPAAPPRISVVRVPK